MEGVTSVTMIPVVSSNVISVGYDAGSSMLYVVFKGNRRYAYEGVPKVKFDALVCADSIGGYLNDNIKREHPVKKLA